MKEYTDIKDIEEADYENSHVDIIMEGKLFMKILHQKYAMSKEINRLNRDIKQYKRIIGFNILLTISGLILILLC